MNTSLPQTAEAAYNKVAFFLRKNAKDIETPDEVLELHCDAIEKLVGVYSPAVDMLVRAYYNIEDFVEDGQPMTDFWYDVEELRER